MIVDCFWCNVLRAVYIHNENKLRNNKSYVAHCERLQGVIDVQGTFTSNRSKSSCVLSDRNKFIWLLSNEDRDICKNVANFIATCLSIRDSSDK